MKFKHHFVCHECGEHFYAIPIVNEHGHYCSEECVSLAFVKRLQEQEMSQNHFQNPQPERD